MIDRLPQPDGDVMTGNEGGSRNGRPRPAESVRGDPCAAQVNDFIVRAKREWEGTVDALDDIVCLVNAGGRIVRANRATEHWGLGPVRDAIGRTPHELLHPECTVARCQLAASIRRHWKEVQGGEQAEFEHRAADRATYWHIALKPLRLDAVNDRQLGEALAVLVVSNVSELRRTRDALEKLNAGLEGRVRDRTRELADANRDLRNEIARRESAERAQRSSLEELARLSEALITAQEHERRRIAAELHDSVGQLLTAVKYSLERAVELLRRPGSGDVQSVLDLAIDGLQQAAESSRAIAMNLRPAILDDMGAASAVSWFCRQFAEFYPSLSLRTVIGVTDKDIPDRLGTAVFRSAQELLNNVAKHASASAVTVELGRDDAAVWIEVRDDGVGMPRRPRSAPPSSGHGIRNLRERAEMTGGKLSIRAAAPTGTTARICWRLMHDELSGKEEACTPR